MDENNLYVRLTVMLKIVNGAKLKQVGGCPDSYAACVGEYFTDTVDMQIPGCQMVDAEAVLVQLVLVDAAND